MDIDSENRAVLVMINQADHYYREQQRLAKMLRKGFLDLAKARSAVGPSCSISALDTREELHAQFTLAMDDIESVSVGSLEAADSWRKCVTSSSAGVASAGGGGERLRRRGMDAFEDGTTTSDPDEPTNETDTVLLFTALAPPALRKAKREFVNALGSAIKLANAVERIKTAQAKLATSVKSDRFAV